MKYAVVLLLGVVLLATLVKASSEENDLEKYEGRDGIVHREKRGWLCNKKCKRIGKSGGECTYSPGYTDSWTCVNNYVCTCNN